MHSWPAPSCVFCTIHFCIDERKMQPSCQEIWCMCVNGFSYQRMNSLFCTYFLACLANWESQSNCYFPLPRIECEDGSVKEGNFKVTRMRCWRITVQQVSTAGHLDCFTSSFFSSIAFKKKVEEWLWHYEHFLFIAFSLLLL